MDCARLETHIDAYCAGELPQIVTAEAAAHIDRCESCSSALRGLQALRAQRSVAVPCPDPQLFERTMALTTAQPTAAAPRSRFWQGAGLGATVAASLVWALLAFLPASQQELGQGVPAVTMALNEVRAVDVALEAPAAIRNAQIRVLLRGDIGLDGFAEQREISWSTDLDAGVNKLSLPIVAFGGRGGQVLVEVAHENKRRTFVVELHVDPAQAFEVTQPGAVGQNQALS